MSQRVLEAILQLPAWAKPPRLVKDARAWLTLRRDILLVSSAVRLAALIDYGAISASTLSLILPALDNGYIPLDNLKILDLDGFLFIVHVPALIARLNQWLEQPDQLPVFVDASSHLKQPRILDADRRNAIWETLFKPAASTLVAELSRSSKGAFIISLVGMLLEFPAVYVCMDNKGQFLDVSGNCLSGAPLNVHVLTAAPVASPSVLESLSILPPGMELLNTELPGSIFVTSWSVPSGLLDSPAENAQDTTMIERISARMNRAAWTAVGVYRIETSSERVIL